MAAAVRLQAFVALLARQVQHIERAAQDIVISRLLKYARGAQVDLLGELVGLSRTSLDDATYKLAIQLQVYINNASGNPEELAYIAKQIAGSDSVRYSEVGPASYRLYFTGGVLASDLLGIMQKLSPAGVRIIGVSAGSLGPFRMGDRMGMRLLHT